MEPDAGEADAARAVDGGFPQTFARWADAPAIDDDSLAQADGYAALRASMADPIRDRALDAARNGRRAEAVEFATARLVQAPEGPERECERAILAAAVAAVDRHAPEAVFAEAAGWRPDAPFCLSSLIVFVELARASEGWCLDLLKRAGRARPAPARHAALVGRMSIGARVGLERADFAELVCEIIEDRDAGGSLARRLAVLGHGQDDRAFAADLFDRFPGLVRYAAKEALVASLLAGVDGRRLTDDARRLADRVATTQAATRAFWAQLASPSLSVVVVGNSPCAVGQGLGPLIDGHDVVVRFNDSPEDGSFAQDYGLRCDVKMMNRPKARIWAARTRARTILTRQRHALGRTGAFGEEVRGMGKTLAFTSGKINQRLYGELGRLPSSGILFLACLRQARGSLASVSTYGFSFVDMVAGPRGSHYFGAKSAGRHHWIAERSLYDDWTGESASPVQDARR